MSSQRCQRVPSVLQIIDRSGAPHMWRFHAHNSPANAPCTRIICQRWHCTERALRRGACWKPWRTEREKGAYLVQEQDAGLGENGARNGDALLLAAAEADAALAHLRAIALRKRADELMRVGQHGRPLHLHSVIEYRQPYTRQITQLLQQGHPCSKCCA